MNYEKLASSILNNVGGKDNVVNLTHCVTRLRFNLKDNSKANEKALEKLDGVVGVIKQGGQFQVVIGNEVANVYKEVVKLVGVQNNKVKVLSNKNDESLLSRVLDTIAGIFTPILPAITGAGMLKAILILLTTFNVLAEESQTYYILNFISDAAFYFFPVILAYTAAVKFNANPFIAMTIGGVLIHPSFTALVNNNEPVKFLGLPVTLASYSASVIPIILTVWLLSYVEKIVDKITPKIFKFFLSPLLIFVIVAPISLIVIGPLGTIFGNYLAAFISYLNNNLGWLVVGVLGAISPLLVMTGMHYSFFPLLITSFATFGYESMMTPAMLAANIAQGAAAVCVSVKSKNLKLKQLAGSSGFTAVLGITEPAMYGVNLKLKKPFLGVMIGGFVGGLYAGFTGVKSFAMGPPGLSSLPIFMGPGNNLINATITIVISFVVAFIATWIIGFEDPVEEASNEDQEELLVK